MRPDHGLELLLDLDGVKFELERGYDNAHAVMTRHRKRKTSIRDHKHYGQLVEIYHYRTADKLLEDFYIDVNLILNKERDQGI